MTRFSLFLLAFSLLSSPVLAAEQSAFSRLMKRVSNYMNSEPVRKGPLVTAVAAVRGSNADKKKADLDQSLLERVSDLRGAALLGGSAADEAALRSTYRALALSQAVQALAEDRGPKLAQEVSAAIKEWAALPYEPQPKPALKALLAGPAEALSADSLLDNGWEEYVDAVAAHRPPALGAADDLRVAPATAQLDEALKSVQASLTQKKLPARERAEGRFLAAQVYAQLMRAQYQGTAAAPTPVSRKEVSVPASDLQGQAAPAAPLEPKRVYGKASKAVVLIVCTSPEGAGEIGSGSLIGKGRVLTNAHVVVRDSTREPWPMVRVYLKPARMTGDPKQDARDPVLARVVAWDAGLDLALLQLDGANEGRPSLKLGDPESVDIGDRVAAIGHPEQGGLWTLTTGVISTLVADLGGVAGKAAFQTDTSINRGNSGGPLLNGDGDIVGVNTSMSRKAADGLAITAVNFAVRSDVVKRWLAQENNPVAYAKARKAAPVEVATVTETVAAPPAPAEPVAVAPPPAPAPAPRPKPAPKKVVITESKPFDGDALIEAQIAEMEDLESEMKEEIRKRKTP